MIEEETIIIRKIRKKNFLIEKMMKMNLSLTFKNVLIVSVNFHNYKKDQSKFNQTTVPNHSHISSYLNFQKFLVCQNLWHKNCFSW